MIAPLRVLRRWIHDHPRTADALLAGAVAAMAVIVHLSGRHGHHSELVNDPSVAGVLLSLAATVPLAWRRRWPLLILIVVTIPQFALELMNTGGPGWLGILIGCYSVGRYGSGEQTPWIGVVFSVVATAFVILGIVAGDAPPGALISTLVLFPAAIIFGEGVRRRRERTLELAMRAEHEAREQELLARQQVQDERTRIARELHDVVAHSVSVMVIQAAAARRQLSSNPAQATEALEAIEVTGRAAMDEMRRILGVLRRDDGAIDGEDERTPVPSLAMLPALVSADRTLPVTLHMDDDLDEIPPGIALNAYRIVQEALTNVRRHAGPVRTVTVTVTRRASPSGGAELEVTVTDDGRGASTQLGARDAGAKAETGHGLAGMRERVLAGGGQLTAGPRKGGGWRVHAVFPVTTLAPSPA